MKDGKKKLTTNAGAPVADNQNVMTAGPRGPMLMQDVWFLEKTSPILIARSSPSEGCMPRARGVW